MSRTQEEILADYRQKLKNTVLKRLKPNPNHYHIVDKWNYKYVIRPNIHEIFDMIEDAMCEVISNDTNIMGEIIKDYMDKSNIRWFYYTPSEMLPIKFDVRKCLKI